MQLCLAYQKGQSWGRHTETVSGTMGSSGPALPASPDHDL